MFFRVLIDASEVHSIQSEYQSRKGLSHFTRFEPYTWLDGTGAKLADSIADGSTTTVSMSPQNVVDATSHASGKAVLCVTAEQRRSKNVVLPFLRDTTMFI